MLKRFQLLPCNNTSENGNDEYVVGLCPPDEPNVILYFPIQEEDAKSVNYLLNPEEFKDSNPNIKVLGLYKTMNDGFESSGTFLSGVILGFEVSENEDILHCQLCLSRVDGGYIESVMKTSLPNAVILAAMNGLDILVTNDLFEKIIQNESPENQRPPKKSPDKGTPDKGKKFPADKDISKIAKRIMNGRMKK